MNPSTVYLVGAGPADPHLITLRAARLLELADVVIYDHLANPRLLGYCPRAQTVYVGKVASAHSMSQEQINELLIENARAGKRVVRLKGGDPFVFGRGGEEAEALVRAGVPFEVVPGITAGIAAPAYAGIPVTHRDFSSSFTLVTGHERDDEPASDIDWSVLAKLPSISFYMGVKSLPQICRRLIENGMHPKTPAATIQWGTSSRQRTVVGTIADLPQRVSDAGLSAPAITFVGKSVTLRQTLNWFESRPLFGQTIIITRTRQQASELTFRLEELGARVIEAPTIELHEPDSWNEVDDALKHAHGFDWIIFTSANGVSAVRDRLRTMDRDVRLFGNAKLAAIGDATADAIRNQLCLHVDVSPEQFVAEALADALATRGQIAGKRFLLLRADIARPMLREKLEQSGAREVRDVAVYQTKPASSLPSELLDALKSEQVNWITFTSSSTVTNFLKLLGSDSVEKLKPLNLASIGPVTSQTLRAAGLEPTAEPSPHTLNGLVAGIVKHQASRRS